MKTITGETTGNKVAYEDIEKLVTPRGLQNCETNTLILSMKVRTISKITLTLVRGMDAWEKNTWDAWMKTEARPVCPKTWILKLPRELFLGQKSSFDLWSPLKFYEVSIYPFILVIYLFGYFTLKLIFNTTPLASFVPLSRWSFICSKPTTASSFILDWSFLFYIDLHVINCGFGRFDWFECRIVDKTITSIKNWM